MKKRRFHTPVAQTALHSYPAWRDHHAGLVRYIRSTSDGTKDLWIRDADARAMFTDGLIGQDMTNSKSGAPAYCPMPD